MYDEQLVKRLRSEAVYLPEKFSKNAELLDVLMKAADAIEELSMKLHGDEAAIAGMKREIERMVVAGKPRWIPVTERLPEERTDVLAMTADCDIYVCDFLPSVRQFWTIPGDDLHIDDITHWMPLPEPPMD